MPLVTVAFTIDPELINADPMVAVKVLEDVTTADPTFVETMFAEVMFAELISAEPMVDVVIVAKLMYPDPVELLVTIAVPVELVVIVAKFVYPEPVELLVI